MTFTRYVHVPYNSAKWRILKTVFARRVSQTRLRIGITSDKLLKYRNGAQAFTFISFLWLSCR